MANYVGNILKCSKDTAKKFLTTDDDGYFNNVDFRKAFNIPPYDYSFVFIDYSWSIYVDELPNNNVMINFVTRGYKYYTEEIRKIITAFPDIAWYCIEECVVEQAMFFWETDHVEVKYRKLFQNEIDSKVAFDINYERYDQIAPEKEIIFYADTQNLVIEDFYNNVAYLYHLSIIDTMQIKCLINSYFEYSTKTNSFDSVNNFISYAYKSFDPSKEMTISLYNLNEYNNEIQPNLFFEVNVSDRDYIDYNNDNYGKVIINQLTEIIELITTKYEKQIIVNYEDKSAYED